MIAYNKKTLDNLSVRDQAEDALDAGCISREEKYPDQHESLSGGFLYAQFFYLYRIVCAYYHHNVLFAGVFYPDHRRQCGFFKCADYFLRPDLLWSTGIYDL